MDPIPRVQGVHKVYSSKGDGALQDGRHVMGGWVVQ